MDSDLSDEEITTDDEPVITEVIKKRVVKVYISYRMFELLNRIIEQTRISCEMVER